MARHDDASTYADLLARLGDDGTKELFRRLLERALQDLLDTELTSRIGAGRHERSGSRSNWRNGARTRTLSTPAGDLELRIPKVRVGSFFPSLLEPRRRVDKALWAVIMTAYITGTSQRRPSRSCSATSPPTGAQHRLPCPPGSLLTGFFPNYFDAGLLQALFQPELDVSLAGVRRKRKKEIKMSPNSTIDTSSVPTEIGFAKEVDIPATRYRQGDRTFYSVTLDVIDLVKVLELPDPTKILPESDNRVVQEKRARDFGIEYVLRADDRHGWICPPMIVRADMGELKVDHVVHKFDNGTAWVVLKVPTTLAWRILDGQHRALGFDMAVRHCAQRIRDLRDLVQKSEKNGQPDTVTSDLKAQLAFFEAKLKEMSDSHVSTTLVEASRDAGKQMFVDIARNAKGVNPDFTTVLDSRSVVHRIALEVATSHPLLIGRVERGQKSRMSKSNPNLVGAKAVADIVHGVIVGSGRVGRRKEVKVVAFESTYVTEVRAYLDALVAGFDDLAQVERGELDPVRLREDSLLGSATMLRALAITWHELRAGDESEGIDRMPIGEIEEFYRSLSPHMRSFTEVEVLSPTTGEAQIARGIARDDSLWMPTKAFRPGSKAPDATQGAIKDLSRALVGWAREGIPVVGDDAEAA